MKIKKVKSVEEAFNFFEAIPENKWTVGRLNDKDGCKCMLGHLGVPELEDKLVNKTNLQVVLKPFIDKGFVTRSENLYNINDGNNYDLFSGDNFIELGDTPKERVLNALIIADSGIMEEL